MAQCMKCGEELDAKAKFCLICGTPVEEKSEAVDSPDPFKTVVKDAPAYGVVNLEQLPEGHLIDDRYEVKGKLGQGGFGAVYRVFDRKMECEKALKVLPEAVASDRAAMVGLKKEAVTMAKLNHPGVVRVFDFCDTGSIKYIDMEFVQGASLSDALVDAPEGRFDEAHVTRLARQLAEGLAYAHTQGVIHKDIKAQNILITKDGTPKITDFGISETVKSSMSRVANSSSAGTLVYMSPEQINGRSVGREADVYSFGALLYELLSGHPPFYKGAIEHQILNNPPEPLDGVSPSLNRLVLRCLEKAYSDRFRSFEEVQAALAGKKVTKGSSPGGIPEPTGKASGKPMWMAVAAVVVLVAAVGVYGLVGKDGPKPGEQVTVDSAAEAQASRSVKKLSADASPQQRMAWQVEDCKETISQLEGSIGSMKDRLDSGSVRKGDSLEAMLGLIQQKKEKTIELERLQEEKDNWAYNQLKKDIEVYKGLIATEEGKGLKETAWRRLVEKHPTEARGVADYDTKALLDGGRLTVKASPEGATVRILNIEPAYSTGMKLVPGRYEVAVSHEGYVSRKTTVTVAKGEEARVRLDLGKLPTLTIQTTPANAQIVLKGIPEKYSPGMVLDPGTYRVLVKAKNRFSREIKIKLAAGENKSVRIGLKKELNNGLGMEFVYIKPGTFTMGSASGEPGRDDDEKQHRVTLDKGYYLQTTEVTQGQWRKVMGENPSHFMNCGDDCPVEKVSWEDAQRFIRKLNARDGGTFYRLPTEAEWEYACRAGSDTPYANGNRLSSLGWFDNNSGYRTHPVAMKKANGWGGYDMHGNVWEWCQDWKGDYPSGHVTDPVGPSSGSNRVLRGGSWDGSAESCRSAERLNLSPGFRDSGVGFRLARTL